jgi:nucleoside-specific outer membrane channel protein Tsx
MKLTKVLAIALIVMLSASVASAAIWSSTSVSFLTGTYENSLSETDYDASVITFEHASGWEYGDNFLFVDMKRETDSYGNVFYGEWHPRFSLGKLTGNDFAMGMVKDIAVATEVNFWGGNRAYLYGVGFDLDLPHFNWFAINFMVRDDRSIADETSFQISPAWSMPITVGSLNFEFNGFLDYSTAEGEGAEAILLTQPQLLLDVGNFMNKGGSYYAGIEYQYWKNMYGVEGLDDNAIQLMGKWVF